MIKEINNNLLNNEEEEMVYCECKYCGEEFEAEEKLKVCKECKEVLDNADNPKLIIALAEKFNCSVQDVLDNGDGEFSIDGLDYLVLTKDEADDKVADYIEDSLWAFSPSFLSSVTGVDSEVFEAIQANGRCEDNNDAIMSIISATNTDMKEVAKEAVRWDGRGHFLSSYDGKEIEVYANGEYYYCYRQ